MEILLMRWVQKRLIFKSENNYDWMISHASIPIADTLDNGRLRIYFSTRDQLGCSRPAFIEVLANDPQQILYIHDKPLLNLGKLGTFDDSGIMPSWLVNYRREKYLYYIGWNPQITVPYRLSIGLAISLDGGINFEKYSEGPICDRDLDEIYFNTAPCVMIDNGMWRMWYVSCTGWQIVNQHPEPSYHVKYAESSDGIHWRKTGHVCIDYDEFSQAIGRPCVYLDGGVYRMFYSFRSTHAYRTDPGGSYRLGYAESPDGITWIRKDNEVGISRSQEGWDSQMMEYCHILHYEDKTYMFYNGNGFGKSGFGYAILEDLTRHT
jgi:hypothetical protein